MRPRHLEVRSVLLLVAAVSLAALSFRLGLWQLDRAAQKQALQQQIEARSALPVLPQRLLARDPADAPGQYQRRVKLRGEWLASATVFLDNRQMNGRPGFFVLTPLRLHDPDAPAAKLQGLVIWVQRGWIARDNDVRTRLPAIPTPAGVVDVAGRVAPPPARLFQFAADDNGPIRQNLDLDASAHELAQPVLPMSILQTEDPSSGADGLLRQWTAPASDIRKHQGYAFQWMALCALVVGLYGWFQIIRPRWPAQRETD